MDPASLALSVATVIETASRLVELLHDIKEGGKQRIRLTAEVSSIWMVLENVKSQLDELSSSPSQVPSAYLKTLGQTNGPLQQCAELLDTLKKKLAPKSGPGRVLQTLKWSFDKEDLEKQLDMLHRLQTSISVAYAQTSLKILQDVAASTSATRRAVEGQEMKQLLEWLSPIDFEAQQRQAYSEWYPGTMEWALQQKSYLMFKGQDNPYLWCSSGPGSGKTVFCSLVIHDLQALAADDDDVVVLGVYLNSRTTNQSDSSSCEILGSLLKQLCVSSHGPDEELRNTFRTASRSNKIWNAEDILKHLKRLMTSFKKSFLVVDAIDELHSQKRRFDLTRNFKALSSTLSILMTGRPDQKVARLCAPLLSNQCDVCRNNRLIGLYHCRYHLGGGWDVCASCFAQGHIHCGVKSHTGPIYLASSLVIWFEARKEDIELYARQRIENDDQLEALLDSKDSLKRQVIDKVVSECKNRFLTAKLYLSNLATYERVKEIKSALQAPMGNLDQTYAQALQSLNQQKPDRVRMAREAIKWVLFAKEPISGLVLEQAVQLGVEGSAFDEEDIVPIQRLLDFTSGLLTQDHQGYIEFIHTSADECLDKVVGEWFPKGSTELCKCCLEFLTKSDFARNWSAEGEASVVRLRERYPLQVYAACNWSRFMRSSEDETINALARTFFQSKALLSTATLSMASTTSQALTPDTIANPLQSALHMAAQFHTEFVTLQLLKNQVYTNLDARDRQGRTVLQLAAMHGQVQAVSALLNAGASPEIADNTGATPLTMALDNFNDSVAKVLVSKVGKAIIDKVDKQGRTPLLSAINHRCYEAALGLLRSGAALQVRDSYGRTVLHYAVRTKRAEFLTHVWSYDLVRALIDVRDQSGDTALHVALRWSYESHYNATLTLVASAANVDVVGQGGKTARQIARERGINLSVNSIKAKHEDNSSTDKHEALLPIR